MSDESPIEWLNDPVTGSRGASWNPVSGCEQIPGVKGRPSGCDHCYAKLLLDTRHAKIPSSPRFGLPFEVVLTHENRLAKPLQWQRPRRIFVNSLSDLFHVNVPDQFIRYVFAVMLLAQRHTFLLLTKRPERMKRFMRAESLESIAASLPCPPPWPNWSKWDAETALTWEPPGAVKLMVGRKYPKAPPQWPPANVQMGVSVSTNDDLHRVIELSETPNALPWISAEPLLGDFDRIPFESLGVKWVVVGGESGPGARPMHAQWARGLRDRCVTAGIPFFFKQFGQWAPRSMTGNPPANMVMVDVGKKAAGRTLDGRTWDEYPDVEPVLA